MSLMNIHTNKYYVGLMKISIVVIVIWLGTWFARDGLHMFQRHPYITRGLLAWGILGAPWFTSTKTVMNHEQAVVLNYAVLTALIIAGISCWWYWDNFRDYLGHQYISGYTVEYVPDVDSDGNPTMRADWHTASWITSVALYIGMWLNFLLPIVSVGSWWYFSKVAPVNFED